jgi:hypothetical protein
MTFRHLRNVRGFFSDYYLGSVFGREKGRRRRRVSDRDSDVAYRRFKRIYEGAEGRGADAASVRERLARPLFRDVLGFHIGEGADRVHPLFPDAESASRGESPIGVLYVGAWHEDLSATKGKSAPFRQVERALAASQLGHGFLITGECCRLVRAPSEGPRGSCLEVDLAGLAEQDDPESFAAFYRIFHSTQFLPGEDGSTAILEVERESRAHAERVSEDLKRAVFSAAEVLAGSLLWDAQRRGAIEDPVTLGDDDLRRYRDAALTALYRILFILYAEARDPRLDEHRIYRDSYSIHGLVDELVADPARDWPDNRSSLWARLQAVFEIYDHGLPRITPWEHIPPRGGDFFSSKTGEGQLLAAAKLPDRTTARLLLDLTTSTPRHGVGRERVSFRELDIESLGAVYEGLLEFEPRVAAEPTIELRVQGRLFVLPAPEVLRLCESKNLAVKGEFGVVEGTAAESLHPEAPTDDDDDDDADADADEEAVEDDVDAAATEDEDPEDGAGLKKGAGARLLRRLDVGAFHFVPGPARKGSGSFYTPRPLVRDLVRRAVGPLVEGRTSAEIETVRILDPACGSAHFLVEAMRFMGRELHRAYVQESGSKPPAAFRSTTGLGWDDDWRASDEEARAANSEARAWCKRRIAERCLFGVDQNPTAVSLARVALWIESLAGDRPLTFFEHHIRNGNSLLGTWLDAIDRPPLPAIGKRGNDSQINLFSDFARRTLRDAAAARLLIDRAADEGAVEAESIEEQSFKAHQLERANEILSTVRLLFDLRSAAAFVPEIWAEWETLCGHVSDRNRLEGYTRSRPWREAFEKVRQRERFFHWEVEFPEVFLDADRTGFDAVLGNPPWDKVLPAKHDFYARYDVLIRAFKGNDLDRRIREIHAKRPELADEFEAYQTRTKTVAQLLRKSGDFPLSEARSQAAHEDVSKYFVDRAARLAGKGGAVGMIVPSVLYNGDGCVGIRRFLLHEATIERFYGFENRKKVFPIDSRYKFVSLVFRRGEASDGFDAAFMRHDLAELEEGGEKPWIVHMTHDEIERLSPESLAFLEYRSPRDQEIVRKMHAGCPTLGGDEPGAWGVEMFTDFAHMQIYNSSRDKDLWTDPKTGKLYTPASVLGFGPADFAETLERMRERGFWPVFEGKHIDQFVVGIKPVRWWLSVAQAEAKYGRLPRNEPLLVFRETARNTDERTCIAATLPAESAAAHTACGLIPQRVDPDRAAAVLNSLCFDYALRLRTAGTHVSFTYMRPMPVPPMDATDRLPTIPTRLPWETGTVHMTDDRELWPSLWEANRAVGEAYGLDADDFAHILGSFPGFARKRSEFFSYLLERVGEWKTRHVRDGEGATNVRTPAGAASRATHAG